MGEMSRGAEKRGQKQYQEKTEDTGTPRDGHRTPKGNLKRAGKEKATKDLSL